MCWGLCVLHIICLFVRPRGRSITLTTDPAFCFGWVVTDVRALSSAQSPNVTHTSFHTLICVLNAPDERAVRGTGTPTNLFSSPVGTDRCVSRSAWFQTDWADHILRPADNFFCFIHWSSSSSNVLPNLLRVYSQYEAKNMSHSDHRRRCCD